MKPTRTLLAALLSIATVRAWAQIPSSQATNDATVNGNTTTRSESYPTANIPSFYQTDYNGMGGIPQYRAESPIPSYIGVLGEKWETDKRGRRSTFIHNGREMSVGYGLSAYEQEHRTQGTLSDLPSSMADSLKSKKNVIV